MESDASREQRIFCKYYGQGACKNGSKCHYSHDMTAQRDNTCRYFASGHCAFGSCCRYDHIRKRSDAVPADTNESSKGGIFSNYRNGDGCLSTVTTSTTPVISCSPDEDWQGNLSTLQPEDDLYCGTDGDDDAMASVGVELAMAALSDHDDGAVACGNGDNLSAHVVTDDTNSLLSISPPFSASQHVIPNLWGGEGAVQFSEITKRNVKLKAVGYLATDGTRRQAVTSEVSLCPFAASYKGCRFGEGCRYIHGERCSSCGLLALHPTNEDQRESHMKKCVEETERRRWFNELKAEGKVDNTIECAICMEVVSCTKDGRYGLLTGCSHAFCLDCIRGWRSTDGRIQSSGAARSCPVCREPTHFVIPTPVFVTNGPEKNAIIGRYKASLAQIDCANFNKGAGHCKFGPESCFYRHVYANGRQEEWSDLRHYGDINGTIRVVQPVQLSDFIGDFPT